MKDKIKLTEKNKLGDGMYGAESNITMDDNKTLYTHTEIYIPKHRFCEDCPS